MEKKQMPEIINKIAEKLINSGFEAYLVGGCVRDLLLSSPPAGGPKDWDITTNALPEQIEKLFPKTVYENSFGTVAVINENVSDETLKVVEITPYRLESKYSDKRHPDKVVFTGNIKEDLKRRDFTINAMAMNLVSLETIDLFDGQKDLKNKVIRAVGNPEERFNEDALRILRAIRFSAELGFSIDSETEKALKKQVNLLENISKERIKDEFVKIIMSPNPVNAIEKMRESGILKHVIPELEDGYGIDQNKAHKFDVWTHNLFSLRHATDNKWPLEIRLAALLHDVGKPASRRWNKDKKDWTFYNHEVIGAKMTAKILTRLKFSKRTSDLITKLVRYHLFFSDTEKITFSAVRRIIRNVGPENVWDLMKVRFSDRIGMGRPKETPYRLRKYEAMIEEAMRSPFSVQMLNIDGKRVMKLLNIQPGPKIGQILHILLEETIDAPENNTKEWLENRVLKLGKMSDKELEKLGEKAKDTKKNIEEKEVSEIRKRWYVK